MLPTYIQPDGSVLRAGFTTGTCAAAAARAAVLLLFTSADKAAVDVETPAGISLSLPLALSEKGRGFARCAVRKDAGDDPDITHGALVLAEARPYSSAAIILQGGEGVGRVTKPGLAVPPGEAAINPGPRAQIIGAVSSVLPPGKGVSITISVPGGEALAIRTLNPELGIVGGISILGTTGIVEPMSSHAFRQSLLPQIDIALAAGQKRLVLTPGKMGKRNAQALLPVADEAVVVTSNFIGFMLQACAAKGIRQVVLCGHIGKLVKVAAGITDTHSAVADARRETLVAHAALQGAPRKMLQVLMSHRTAEESVSYLAGQGYTGVLASVAEAAARRAEAMAGGRLTAGCILLDLSGKIIAVDALASSWLEEWKND